MTDEVNLFDIFVAYEGVIDILNCLKISQKDQIFLALFLEENRHLLAGLRTMELNAKTVEWLYVLNWVSRDPAESRELFQYSFHVL